MKHILNPSDFKKLKNKINETKLTSYEKLYEDLDFSNKIGWSESLIGRFVNKIFSFTAKQAQKLQLKKLRNLLIDEYLKAVMLTVAETKPEVFKEKSNLAILNFELKNSKNNEIYDIDNNSKTYDIIYKLDKNTSYEDCELIITCDDDDVKFSPEKISPVKNDNIINAVAPDNKTKYRYNVIVNLFSDKSDNIDINIIFSKNNNTVNIKAKENKEIKNNITILTYNISVDKLSDYDILVIPIDDNAKIEPNDKIKLETDNNKFIKEYIVTAENGNQMKYNIIIENTPALNQGKEQLALNTANSTEIATINKYPEVISSLDNIDIENNLVFINNNVDKHSLIENFKKNGEKLINIINEKIKKDIIENDDIQNIIDVILLYQKNITDLENNLTESDEKEIIKNFNINIKTLKNILNNILAKTDVKNKKDLLSKVIDKIKKTEVLKLNEKFTFKSLFGSFNNKLDNIDKKMADAIKKVSNINLEKINTEKIQEIFKDDKIRERAIKNVNKEALKELEVRAEWIFNTENYKDKRSDTYSRVNFTITTTDKLKLEHLWNIHVATIKKEFNDFFKDNNNNFPQSLDPIALVKSDKQYRERWNQYTEEERNNKSQFKDNKSGGATLLRLEEEILENLKLEDRTERKLSEINTGIINITNDYKYYFGFIVNKIKFKGYYIYGILKIINYNKIYDEVGSLTGEITEEKVKEIITKNTLKIQENDILKNIFPSTPAFDDKYNGHKLAFVLNSDSKSGASTHRYVICKVVYNDDGNIKELIRLKEGKNAEFRIIDDDILNNTEKETIYNKDKAGVKLIKREILLINPENIGLWLNNDNYNDTIANFKYLKTDKYKKVFDLIFTNNKNI